MPTETLEQAELRKTIAEADLAERRRNESGRALLKRPAFLGSFVPLLGLAFGILKYTLEWDTLEADQARLEIANQILGVENQALEQTRLGLEVSIASLEVQEVELDKRVAQLETAATELAATIDSAEATFKSVRGVSESDRIQYSRTFGALRASAQSLTDVAELIMDARAPAVTLPPNVIINWKDWTNPHPTGIPVIRPELLPEARGGGALSPGRGVSPGRSPR